MLTCILFFLFKNLFYFIFLKLKHMWEKMRKRFSKENPWFSHLEESTVTWEKGEEMPRDIIEQRSRVWGLVLNSDGWWFVLTMFFISLSQSPMIHFRSNTIRDWNVCGWLFCGWVVGFLHSIVVVCVDII